METDLDSLALTTVYALNGRSLATAESVTGGAIGEAITAIPGASKSFRGGIVAYASDLKVSLLDVPAGLIESGGGGPG